MVELALVGALVLLNAAFAGTEMALVSLRDSQVNRMEQAGGRGRVVAGLVRDPNRFLATIQIGITLAGFLASAAAAVSLAEPLVEPLGFLGGAAEPVAIGVVTLVLTFLTLVFGELAPKRIAMQRAERWALVAARPLAALAGATRPAVWLLSKTSDAVVRIVGADRDGDGDSLSADEVRDIVATQSSFGDEQRTIIAGALEIGDRVLRDVLVPRRSVVWIPADVSAPHALSALVGAGHSRAPVARGELDDVLGIVNLRELVGARGPVTDHMRDALVQPETKRVVDALREMQGSRVQLAVVADEYGGVAGIITVEDLVEEIVGEIWDETDRDIVTVERQPDGSMVLPGTFPAHDLVDVGVEVPAVDATTLAGVVLEKLGRIPDGPGDVVELERWRAEVLAVERRAITSVRLTRR